MHDLEKEELNLEKKHLEIQLDKISKSKDKRIATFEHKIIGLQNENEKLSNEILNTKRMHREELEKMILKYDKELGNLRAEKAQNEKDAPYLKEKYDSLKIQLGDMSISEERYFEILKVPENLRSLKDNILLKVHERLRTTENELEKYRLDCNTLRQNIIRSSEDLKISRNEIDRLKQEIEDKDLEFKRIQDQLRIQAKLKTNDALDMKQEIDEAREKASRYNELKRKLDEIIDENKRLKSNEVTQFDSMKQVLTEKEAFLKEITTLKQEISILNADKNFYIKESTALGEKVHQLEERNERLDEDLMRNKKQLSDCVDKLLNTKDQFSNKYEEKFTAQINELKEQQQREIDQAKKSLTEIYEKRISYMQQMKDEMELRLTKSENELKDKSAAYDELNIEHRMLLKKLDEECGSLRLELRFKTEEVARINNIYEDNIILVKQSQAECSSLKDKLDLLKSEYYKLEAKCRQEQSDIRAENSMLKERIANYENIEKELDNAILNVANADKSSDVTNTMIQTIATAPTSSKRRIQQNLLLANKLVAKQKELESLRDNTKKIEEENFKLSDQIKAYKKISENTSQPYSYMAASLEKAEMELLGMRRELKERENVINQLKAEIQILAQSKRSIEEDLNRLLSKRQNIEALQNTLVRFTNMNPNQKLDVNDLRESLKGSIYPNDFKKKQSPKSIKKQREMENIGDIPQWVKSLKTKLSK